MVSTVKPISDKLTQRGRSVSEFPVIGVVTPVRNRRDWSIGFIRRFAEQDYPVFRHYIVDSASTDGTPEAVQGLGLNTVRLIHAPSSAYWTAATNLGVAQALSEGCEYILTINDDAIIADDFLSGIVNAALAADQNLVGSVIAYVDRPHILWGVGAYNDFENGRFVQTRWADLPDDTLQAIGCEKNGLIKAENLCGNGTLVHKSVFKTIGLYDAKNTPHYHADTEMTMRAEKAGFTSWIAPQARVYNRFTEDQDGPLARKNRRFFSLRSANYVRPVLFILRTYCSPELRVRAFLGYLARYLPTCSPRQSSKILRMAVFLSSLPESTRSTKVLIPGKDRDQNFLEDIALLYLLNDHDFIRTAYAYLLRRYCGTSELESWLVHLKKHSSREALLLELVSSPEFGSWNPGMRTFASGVVEPDRISAAMLAESELTARQRKLLEELLSKRAMPAKLKAAMRTVVGFFKGGSPFSVVEPSLRSVKRLSTQQSSRKLQPEAKRLTPDALVLYFNADVLCMAQLDPKAATGVYRYALSVFQQFLLEPGLTIRLFFSPGLENGFDLFVAQHPGSQSLLLDADEPVSERGVVFYPYFAIDERNARLAGLPTALTICDLFPLVNPEWFSDEAVRNFRRQLRILPDVDHIFCISKSTEKQLRKTIPGLRATSSVAYLAAADLHRAKHAQPNRRSDLPDRFFLCVGTIEPRKNLKNVLQAFSLLSTEATANLNMVVVGQEGWSISKDELQDLAGRNASRIHFLGRVSDQELAALYQTAQFTVFPSLAEGFGLPIVESFSQGTPVITSSTSSMAEIAGDAAILVDPLDPSAIAGAIQELTTNPDSRARLASLAQNRSGDFSWQACASEHVRIFRNLFAAQARPRSLRASLQFQQVTNVVQTKTQ